MVRAEPADGSHPVEDPNGLHLPFGLFGQDLSEKAYGENYGMRAKRRVARRFPSRS